MYLADLKGNSTVWEAECIVSDVKRNETNRSGSVSRMLEYEDAIYEPVHLEGEVNR